MPNVSVIIPVWNAEKYLPECLDTICRQTLSDIEIICVDDGSDDASGEILAPMFPRMTAWLKCPRAGFPAFHVLRELVLLYKSDTKLLYYHNQAKKYRHNMAAQRVLHWSLASE